MIDKYLELIMLSREYRLSDLVGNYNCFEAIFNIKSNKIQEFLAEAYIDNTESMEVNSLLWDPRQTMLTFGTNHSMLSAECIRANVV